MKEEDQWNLTEKDFQSNRTKRIESLSLALKAQCEGLSTVLSIPNAGYGVSKADEAWGLIKETHQQLLNEVANAFFYPHPVEQITYIVSPT